MEIGFHLGPLYDIKTILQYVVEWQIALLLMKTYKIILVHRSNSTGYKTMLLGSQVLKGMLVSVLYNFSKHQNSSVSSRGQKKFYCQFLFLRVLILIRPVSSAVQVSFQFEVLGRKEGFVNEANGLGVTIHNIVIMQSITSVANNWRPHKIAILQKNCKSHLLRTFKNVNVMDSMQM